MATEAAAEAVAEAKLLVLGSACALILLKAKMENLTLNFIR